MNIVRYLIRKKELHELLRTLGILQPREELLFVSNRDLLDGDTDAASITVASGTDEGGEDDRYQRFIHLALLHDALAADMKYVVEELKKLIREREIHATETGTENEPVIPETIEKSIREQIERILSGSSGSEPARN
jgi:hypothetical protein